MIIRPPLLFEQPNTYSCIAASLKMLLGFYGKEIPFRTISKKIDPHKSGASFLDAAEFLLDLRLSVTIVLVARPKNPARPLGAWLKRKIARSKEFTPERLIHLLREGKPVMVGVEYYHLSNRRPKTKEPKPHTVVVIGYTKDSIIFLDPAKKRVLRRLNKGVFLRAWQVDGGEVLYIETPSTKRG